MNDLGTTDNSTILIVGQIITFLTLVLGWLVTLYREKRNHHWELDERAALAAKVKEDAEALATHVATKADAVAAKVQAASDALASQIDHKSAALSTAIAENTVKTEQAIVSADNAFNEANHVNLKIAAYGKHILAETLDEKKG